MDNAKREKLVRLQCGAPPFSLPSSVTGRRVSGTDLHCSRTREVQTRVSRRGFDVQLLAVRCWAVQETGLLAVLIPGDPRDVELFLKPRSLRSGSLPSLFPRMSQPGSKNKITLTGSRPPLFIRHPAHSSSSQLRAGSSHVKVCAHIPTAL